jgi:predicted TIM-barrel fold metal-dependent hydrolase
MTLPIDAHVHVWSSDQSRYPLARGYNDWDLWMPSFSPEDHEAIAGTALPINLVQMTWYGLDHSYILDLIDSDPDRFTGTGIVPAICDVALARPDRVMLDLAGEGIRAFRIRGRGAQPPREHATETWLEHRHYERMFDCAAEHDLVLSFLCAPADLAEIGRMCERFPETRVIVDHCGGVRIRDATIDQTDLRLLMALSEHSKVYVKFGPIHGLGDVGPSEEPVISDVLELLQPLVTAFGSERLLWESDLGGPVQMVNPQKDFQSCIELIRNAEFLSAEQREHILSGNARKLLWAIPE